MKKFIAFFELSTFDGFYEFLEDEVNLWVYRNDAEVVDYQYVHGHKPDEGFVIITYLAEKPIVACEENEKHLDEDRQ